MAASGSLVNEQSFQKTTAITPSDSTTFNPPLDGFYVGGTGDVAVTDANGSVNTFKNVQAGTGLLVACSKIMLTNTSATNIVGLQR